MKRGAWLLRPIVRVDFEPARHGENAFMTLSCSHVVMLKASRLRIQKPKRVRCEECEEIKRKFFDHNLSAEIVALIEWGTLNDKSANKGGPGRAHFRRYGDMPMRANADVRKTESLATVAYGKSPDIGTNARGR